jgi:hypothetical protein
VGDSGIEASTSSEQGKCLSTSVDDRGYNFSSGRRRDWRHQFSGHSELSEEKFTRSTGHAGGGNRVNLLFHAPTLLRVV